MTFSSGTSIFLSPSNAGLGTGLELQPFNSLLVNVGSPLAHNGTTTTFKELGTGIAHYAVYSSVLPDTGIGAYVQKASDHSYLSTIFFPASDRLAVDTSGRVTVGAYATGQDPATLILVTPANKLGTNASGWVTVAENNDKVDYYLKATQHVAIAQAVLDIAASLAVTVGSFGKFIVDALTNPSVTIVSPVATDGDLTIYAGDDYNSSDNRSISINITSTDTLTAATARLIVGGMTVTGTVTANGGTSYTLVFHPTASDTSVLARKDYPYKAQAIRSSRVLTEVAGTCTVL